ncbi:hypothetical protein M441DRAFT_44369 [Trichoderma asperellum CBS 433.97]|uniref:Methyltransferase domain-containing protein n=1 Tax=Trichoderma asperellum (strain ATCC 204424 / CBS 433.97 / NBRC 101777) TaxID=1042311 RepID=A0A2T3ZHK4_TRIA4|nr:hypothetical protein M441DRAFT_44369 [Trichoderma asperellum CBS 433.97]PTB44287.1 hypothetical protein M441DRAFT_44369 [Trichoderma asperellum CBS 433.97]
MAPLIPRLHLFEIDDQPWFPAFLRSRIQNALTAAWNSNTPLQPQSPARIAASTLIRELDSSLSSYTFIDFCAGGGGPTPAIQKAINTHLKAEGEPPVDFILTDLHPNVGAWEKVVKNFPQIAYERQPVDASKAPNHLVECQDGKKVMRLFNLAFHHFGDALARDILRDTVNTSHGFAIFELQDRSLSSMISVFMLGVASVVMAPAFAWKWRDPISLAFSWLMPALPFVLVFDGIVSCLRTRTPNEIESLLRGCGADTSSWEMRSGKCKFIWPCGYLSWVICRPVERT